MHVHGCALCVLPPPPPQSYTHTKHKHPDSEALDLPRQSCSTGGGGRGETPGSRWKLPGTLQSGSAQGHASGSGRTPRMTPQQFLAVVMVILLVQKGRVQVHSSHHRSSNNSITIIIFIIIIITIMSPVSFQNKTRSSQPGLRHCQRDRN